IRRPAFGGHDMPHAPARACARSFLRSFFIGFFFFSCWRDVCAKYLAQIWHSTWRRSGRNLALPAVRTWRDSYAKLTWRDRCAKLQSVAGRLALPALDDEGASIDQHLAHPSHRSAVHAGDARQLGLAGLGRAGVLGPFVELGEERAQEPPL